MGVLPIHEDNYDIFEDDYYKDLSTKNNAQIAAMYNEHFSEEEKEFIGELLKRTDAGKAKSKAKATDNITRVSKVRDVEEHIAAVEEFLRTNSVSDIYDSLSKRVYKQDNAKKMMSMLLWTHLMKLNNHISNKQNYLMVGPTGSGKTELTRALREISPVPVITIDCTSVTSQGWKGPSLGDVISSQLGNLDDRRKADYAIYVLDEADKLLIGSNGEHDDFSSARQTSLLSILEDGIVTNGLGEQVCNPENATFVLVGAFEGLFNDCTNININYVTSKIMNYGMKPELAGRVSNLIMLNTLSVEDYVHILKNSESSFIKEYQLLYSYEGLDLRFTDAAVNYVATLAASRGLGVRGANQILCSTVLGYVFEALRSGERSLKITKPMVKNLSYYSY